MLARLADAVRPALLGVARAALDAIAGRPAARRARVPASRTGGRRGVGGAGSSPGARGAAPRSAQAGPRSPYPGDAEGPVDITYEPVDDASADPGEVVWAWVPYEEDHSRGKDRPVLVIGRSGPWLLAVPLTSKDHDHDAAQEARAGRHWVDIGTGAWDPRGRPSEARTDRVVRLDPAAVRRVGTRLDRDLFENVAAEVRARRS